MSKKGRGVLYIVWGDSIEATLGRSLKSVKHFHPELPIETVRLEVDPNSFRSLAEKASAFERSPFEETLLLDADTVVMDRLDFGFEKAARFGLACCICEAPWARRYRGLAERGDMIEYNTGVLFFTQTAKPIFDLWRAEVARVDSTIDYVQDGQRAIMAFNDQAGFALAVERSEISPFVLPRNWNFRVGFERCFFGPIKIWHSYSEPPMEFHLLNETYRKGSIIQFHHF